MNARTILYHVAAIGALGAASCTQPLHLQYDFGRAYMTTLRTQADLTRPSIVNEVYFLYGPEAAAIRINVEAATTEAEDTTFNVE